MNICPSRTKFLGWEGVPVQDVSLLVFARLPVAPKAKVEAANPATGGRSSCGTLAKVGKPFEANLLICWELVEGEVPAALVRTLGGGQAVVHHAPVGMASQTKKSELFYIEDSMIPFAALNLEQIMRSQLY